MAFVGKPCDVASAHKAMRTDTALADKIPLTIAIFCAGAPNLNATDKLLDRLGVPKDGKLVDLRYRGQGWPGLMQAEWLDADGARHTSVGIPYAEGWGRILQAERRWRCRVCADHTGAFADIAVGDPWHNPPEGRHRRGPVADRGAHAARAGFCRGRDRGGRAGGRGARARRDRRGAAEPEGDAWRGLGPPRGDCGPWACGHRATGGWRCSGCGGGLSRRAKLQSLAGTWKRIIPRAPVGATGP